MYIETAQSINITLHYGRSLYTTENIVMYMILHPSKHHTMHL